jgi:hypothetical protein
MITTELEDESYRKYTNIVEVDKAWYIQLLLIHH